MTIKLYLREHCVAEEEIYPPHCSDLSFEDNCTMRKFYVDCIKRKMELECVRMIRGQKYHFVLIAESKIELITYENKLKKAV